MSLPQPGGGVNLVSSTSADASGKEVASADFVKKQAGGEGRNIGDIFYTTRTDSELNGAFECNGAQYNIADFSQGAQSVLALLTTGKLPYVSTSDFDTCVSTNGSCRCFGWDGADATVFKVPKLNDVYIEVGTAASAGEFISESLPKPQLVMRTDSSTSTDADLDAIYGNDGYTASIPSNTSGTDEYVHRTYTSGSQAYMDIIGSTYQDNVKVHPDSVRYRAMVQLVNKTTDEALATVTSVLADIVNLGLTKANADASNFTATGKSEIVGWGIPDYTAGISVSYPTEESPFVAPQKGIFTVNILKGSSVARKIYINGIESFFTIHNTSGYQDMPTVPIPLDAGDSIYFNLESGTEQILGFYPFKGA